MLENTERRRLVELLMVPVQTIRIEARSRDWQNASEESSRVSEVLASAPATLSSGITWSEMLNEKQRRLVATVDSKRSMRMDVAGRHVCVQDASGQTWFFRTLEVDGWRR